MLSFSIIHLYTYTFLLLMVCCRFICAEIICISYFCCVCLGPSFKRRLTITRRMFHMKKPGRRWALHEDLRTGFRRMLSKSDVRVCLVTSTCPWRRHSCRETYYKDITKFYKESLTWLFLQNTVKGRTHREYQLKLS